MAVHAQLHHPPPIVQSSNDSHNKKKKKNTSKSKSKIKMQRGHLVWNGKLLLQRLNAFHLFVEHGVALLDCVTLLLRHGLGHRINRQRTLCVQCSEQTSRTFEVYVGGWVGVLFRPRSLSPPRPLSCDSIPGACSRLFRDTAPWQYPQAPQTCAPA